MAHTTHSSHAVGRGDERVGSSAADARVSCDVARLASGVSSPSLGCGKAGHAWWLMMVLHCEYVCFAHRQPSDAQTGLYGNKSRIYR